MQASMLGFVRGCQSCSCTRAHLVRVRQLEEQLRGGVPLADRHPAALCQEEEAGGRREGGALRRGRAVGHVVRARRQHLDAPKDGAHCEALRGMAHGEHGCWLT